jgi:hypothetical protein
MAFEAGEFEVEAAKAAHGVADRLEKVRPILVTAIELPPVMLATKSVYAEQLKAEVRDSQTAIYAISLPDAEPGRIHTALTEARNNKVDDRSYSRALPLPEIASTTLYVGSSRSLQKRLLDHLGHGAKKTSSLHMLTWAQQLGRIAIDVRFYPPTIENDLLCALEDHWAATLKPLFGRRGSV